MSVQDEWLSSRFAGLSSKTSLDRKASPPQSQWKPASAKNSSQVQAFRFFDLPREIRDMVYYFSLPQNVIICGDTKQLCKFWRPDRVLFSVSRQMREESRQMLYVNSTIHISLEDFSSYRTFLAWINTVEQAHVRRIEEVKIYAWLEGCRKTEFVLYFQEWFKDLLDELDWDFPRFRVTDIKAMVDSLYPYSFNNKTPQRGDLQDLASFFESSASLEGVTYTSTGTLAVLGN